MSSTAAFGLFRRLGGAMMARSTTTTTTAAGVALLRHAGATRVASSSSSSSFAVSSPSSSIVVPTPLVCRGLMTTTATATPTLLTRTTAPSVGSSSSWRRMMTTQTQLSSLSSPTSTATTTQLVMKQSKLQAFMNDICLGCKSSLDFALLCLAATGLTSVYIIKDKELKLRVEVAHFFRDTYVDMMYFKPLPLATCRKGETELADRLADFKVWHEKPKFTLRDLFSGSGTLEERLTKYLSSKSMDADDLTTYASFLHKQARDWGEGKREDKLELALSVCDEALELKPKSGKALIIRGQILVALGDYHLEASPLRWLTSTSQRARSRQLAKENFERASSTFEAAAESDLFKPVPEKCRHTDMLLYGNMGYAYWHRAKLCDPRGRGAYSSGEKNLDVPRATARAIELYEKAAASYEVAFDASVNYSFAKKRWEGFAGRIHKDIETLKQKKTSSTSS